MPDHTWAPEMTIHPFGILRVESDMGIEFDKLNRPRGKIPRTGPLTLYLPYENNSVLVASDLLKQVKEANKPVTVCIVDNYKQDLGPACLVTFFAWARLWLASPSDVLIVLSYAPKQLCRNFVELLFGWVSQRLAGHCFNDDKDVARTQMKNVVDGVRDGFLVQCHLPDDARQWADYDTIPAFCAGSNSTNRKKAELKAVYGEFKFFLAHCDRRHNLLSFRRCRVSSCACMRNHPSLWTMFVARMQQVGDVLLSPVPDPQHLGHYATWQQMAYDVTLRAKADEHQPTAMLNGMVHVPNAGGCSPARVTRPTTTGCGTL